MMKHFLIALMLALALAGCAGCATVSPEEMQEQIEQNQALKAELDEAKSALKTARIAAQRLSGRLERVKQYDQALSELLDQLFALIREGGQ